MLKDLLFLDKRSQFRWSAVSNVEVKVEELYITDLEVKSPLSMGKRFSP